MPPSLVASQFATLEPPAAEESALALDVTDPPETLLAAALTALRSLP
jgi:gluconokinase